jgi:hypothetical protein
MPSILEPLGAGLLVALISKYVINNKPLCDSICETKEEEPEIVEGDSSSNTTSVNSAELVHVHHFDPYVSHFLDL